MISISDKVDMTYNFSLLFQMYYKSIFAYRQTGGRFTFKRILFIISFPVWYFFLELVNWACLCLDEILFPGYRNVSVSRPVFVVGFPRSGTTYLHRLLDSDHEQFTSLKLWEIIFAPSILQKKFFLILGKIDRMMGKPLYRTAVKIEDRMFEGSRKMHRISHFEAEEDEIILIHIFSSAFLAFMFPFEEMNVFTRFDTDLPAKRQSAIMSFYKKCVQKHLYVFGSHKHFLSKNPASSSKIRSIYETFPDAKIICMVRNPIEAIPSAISWMSYGIYQFNDADQEVVTQHILSQISHWYTYPLVELDKRSDDAQAIEIYDDLVSHPDEFVKQLYIRFRFEISGPFHDFLTAETQKAKKYKSRHDYSLAQYGLSKEKIVSDFKPVFDRFGFEKD
jgi:omega-hydroxy-beta-dihydromenaquinone-9 sulfotransferase